MDRGFEEVAGDLQGLGFSIKAGLFSAAEVGASHIRKRLFILAHANDKHLCVPDGHLDRAGSLPVPDCDGPVGQPARLGERCESVEHFLAGGETDGFKGPSNTDLPIFAPTPCDLEAWDTHLSRRLDLQPELFGLDDGLANRVERSRAAGNGVVPLVAAYAWRTLKGAFYG
nr:hypothetical protein [uncultured Roseibium sp.]